jgi:phage gpG-like protein
MIKGQSQSSKGKINDLFAKIKRAAQRTFKREGPAMAKAIESTFDAQGRRGGNDRWIPTSEFWIRQRESFPANASEAAQESYVDSAQTLVDTGNLKNSFRVMDNRPMSKGSGEAVLVVGSAVDYARAMHEGGRMSATTRDGRVLDIQVPSRPFMFISDDDSERFADTFAQEFARE